MPTPMAALEAFARSIIDFCLSLIFMFAGALRKTWFQVAPSRFMIDAMSGRRLPHGFNVLLRHRPHFGLCQRQDLAGRLAGALLESSHRVCEDEERQRPHLEACSMMSGTVSSACARTGGLSEPDQAAKQWHYAYCARVPHASYSSIWAHHPSPAQV